MQSACAKSALTWRTRLRPIWSVGSSMPYYTQDSDALDRFTPPGSLPGGAFFLGAT